MDEDKIIQFPTEEVKEENTEDSTTLLDGMSGVMDELGLDFNEFAALLSLPDEQFNTLSEIILDELQKTMNDQTTRILVQYELLQSGYTAADMTQFQAELLQEIETNLKDTLPQNKLDFIKRMMSIITNIYTDVEGAAKSIVSIPIEVMPHGIMPTYAHDGDAAMDIYSPFEYDIDPGETVLIKTGIKVAIPRGYGLLIQPRSGQSLKTKLRVANTPGLIDSGYRDEIGIILENIESPIKGLGEVLSPNASVSEVFMGNEYGQSYHIDKGQRIAQMRLVEVPTINWVPVDNIQDIEGDRGGGFGSSGE